MNRNFKVITVNGFRGVLAAIFVVCGLIAGFVVSPGWLCMRVWNHVFQYSSFVSAMNIWQGIMLWAVIALTLYALNNRHALIGFGSYPGLTPEEIKEVMKKARETEFSAKVSDADIIKRLEENDENIDFPEISNDTEDLNEETKEEARR